MKHRKDGTCGRKQAARERALLKAPVFWGGEAGSGQNAATHTAKWPHTPQTPCYYTRKGCQSCTSQLLPLANALGQGNEDKSLGQGN